MGYRIVVNKKSDIFPLIVGVIGTNAFDIVEAYMAEDLEPESQARAPVDWGTLRDTPTVERVGPRAVLMTFYGGSASGWGGEPRIYAAYNEYGTRFMQAHPFVTPAIDATFPGGVEKRGGHLVDF